MARSAKLISGDRAAKRHQMRVAGDWLLTPDHALLVECERSGAYVRMRSIATGAVVNEVRPKQRARRRHTARCSSAPAAGWRWSPGTPTATSPSGTSPAGT